MPNTKIAPYLLGLSDLSVRLFCTRGTVVPNYIARLCFTLTAIAPSLGAAAIVSVAVHKSWGWGAGFAISGLGAVLLSFLILAFIRKYVQREALEIIEIEQADQRVLEFLLAYMLPVFSGVSIQTMTGSLALTIYSLLIVALTVVHGNMFQFNPVLALFGYHFYVVRSSNRINYLVISKSNFHKADRTITCKRISEYIRLDVTECP